jgi:AcrR family transcriptional regulator
VRPTARLTAAARREAILEASLRLFAEHGLHGVTTRQIAEACGISEALLYRHFPGKESLYRELQTSCIGSSRQLAERLAALPPATGTLVLGVWFMCEAILPGGPGGDERHAHIKRLLLGSLVGDGEFARGFFAENLLRFLPAFDDGLRAAERAGDLDGPLDVPRLRALFAHHVALMAATTQLASPPAIPYPLAGAALHEAVVRFCLRGLGLTSAAIERHLNGAALTAALHRLGAPPAPAPPTRRSKGTLR